MNVQFAGVGESSYLVRRVYVQGVLEPPARDALVDFSSGGHARLAEEYVPVALDAPTAVVARPRRRTAAGANQTSTRHLLVRRQTALKTAGSTAYRRMATMDLIRKISWRLTGTPIAKSAGAKRRAKS